MARRDVTAGRSVRFRITATALGVVGGALLVASLLMLWLLHRSLVNAADARVEARIAEVAALAERGELPATFAGPDDVTVAQVVMQGRVVAQSPLVRGTQPLATFAPAGRDVLIRTVEDPPIADGGDYRIAAMQANTAGGPVVVYAASSLDPHQRSLEIMQMLLATVDPVLILLVGVTTWYLVGRTLEPVEAIRRQVAEISSTGLDRRVPEPATADEIARLARTMNEMLARLDASLRRQRSFVADASHELRSPLASIRTQLEVGLGRPEAVDWPALAKGWLAEQARLEQVVDNLLVLARTDEGARIHAVSVVDLDEIVLRVARDIRSLGKVRLDVAQLTGGRVRGDGEQLRVVVQNLLDNAERHAAASVRIELAQNDGIVELVIADDGPGIAPEHRERVFERFVRLDEARNRRSGGAGLGLAIVRDVVIAHGGTIEVAESDKGARLVVRLPAADPTPADVNPPA